jgi:hypothetical protein
MPDEGQYVYVVTTVADVPVAERYVLVKRTPAGVRVRQYGNITYIRPATDRKIFYTTKEVSAFFAQHVVARMEKHNQAARNCQTALITGIRVIPMPVEALPAPRLRMTKEITPRVSCGGNDCY